MGRVLGDLPPADSKSNQGAGGLRFAATLRSEEGFMMTVANLRVKIPVWLDRIIAWPVMFYRKWKYGQPFRRIYLGENEWTILDQQDYYRFAHLKWCLWVNHGKHYAACNITINSQHSTIIMLHRMIMNAPRGIFVDHKNGYSLDNHRSNLRLATRSQNMCNRPKTKSKTLSMFIGVSVDKRNGHYTAKIQNHGKGIYLGSFKTEIDAARAHDEAAKKYHGDFARLNFS
jgi:hypothetical protein